LRAKAAALGGARDSWAGGCCGGGQGLGVGFEVVEGGPAAGREAGRVTCVWKHMSERAGRETPEFFVCGVGTLLHAAESTPVPALNVTIMHTGNTWRRMYLVSSLSLPEFTMNFTSSLQATELQFATRATLSMMTDGSAHQQQRLITRRRVSQSSTLQVRTRSLLCRLRRHPLWP
jgi:hypothetical protein